MNKFNKDIVTLYGLIVTFVCVISVTFNLNLWTEANYWKNLAKERKEIIDTINKNCLKTK